LARILFDQVIPPDRKARLTIGAHLDLDLSPFDCEADPCGALAGIIGASGGNAAVVF
jgi:hypothetical protein